MGAQFTWSGILKYEAKWREKVVHVAVAVRAVFLLVMGGGS